MLIDDHAVVRAGATTKSSEPALMVNAVRTVLRGEITHRTLGLSVREFGVVDAAAKSAPGS